MVALVIKLAGWAMVIYLAVQSIMNGTFISFVLWTLGSLALYVVAYIATAYFRIYLDIRRVARKYPASRYLFLLQVETENLPKWRKWIAKRAILSVKG